MLLRDRRVRLSALFRGLRAPPPRARALVLQETRALIRAATTAGAARRGQEERGGVCVLERPPSPAVKRRGSCSGFRGESCAAPRGPWGVVLNGRWCVLVHRGVP